MWTRRYSINRRQFLIKSALFGSTLGFVPLIAAKLKKVEQPDILEKVTSAMLSMQRASWEHGVAAQAMLETGNDKMVYLMAKEAVLRQLEDGRFSVVYSDNGNTDPGCVGEAVLRAYQRYGDDELKTGIDKMLDYFLNKAPRSEHGTLYHALDSPEIWSDSFFMCPPFLTACGKYKEALAQIDGIRKVLWNQDQKLFSHRWHCLDKKFIDHRFWGGGNGWAAASFCRVLGMLPGEMRSEKKQLSGYLNELIDGCLVYMREDGLFHNFINEQDTFIETNLAQMLAYSIFRSIKGGWLSKSYLSSAEKMRNAAHAKIDNNGYVTGVCGAPYFETPGRSTEGQAFFLLMEAAYRDLNQ